MAKRIKSYPVAPDSVYVWRGFMAPPPRTYANFVDFLGNVFVPACALLQPKVGLRAYIPTLVPQENKPNAVPDQTALMFWDTSQSHNLANGALAVRIYQNLHGDVYDMSRSSLPENPILLPTDVSKFVAEQPYYLFANTADWMLGQTQHVVGARPVGTDVQSFQSAIFDWCTKFRMNAPKGVDAALVCCGNDYAVAWVHSKLPIKNFSIVLKGFTALLQVQLKLAPRILNLPAGLWNKWNGIDLTQKKNISLNIQLERPAKTIPVK